MCRRTSPRSLSCQHLWAHSPPCAAPPCPASPHRLRRSVLRHCLGAGCGVVSGWSPRCLLVVVTGVGGAGFSCVRGCGYVRWPRIGSSCWPSSVSLVWASLRFDVVGVVAGRGLGCRVTCSRPLPRRHPSGFAGVSFATVLGLVVGLSACCLLVAVVVVDDVFHKSVRCCGRGCWPRCGSSRYLRVVVVGVGGSGHKSVRCCGRGCWPRCGLSCWPWPVSMACASLVFEVVGVVAGRGLGRGEGCCWPLPLSMGLAFRVFDVVVMFDGRGVGRYAGRRCGRWCVPQECSMVWV